MQLLDKFIGVFSPKKAYERNVYRKALKRAYEGASKTDGWKPKRAGASANFDHFADASELRARSRSLVQNVPYIAKGINSLVSNVIGTGLVPRSLARGVLGQKIEDLHTRWAEVADADGRCNLYALQAMAYRAMKVDGEVLIRIRTRRSEDNLPVPMQIQVLEIEWLDAGKNGMVNGNMCVNGIEYDGIGRVVAYWLFDRHPNDVVTTVTSRRESSRIAASSIIHFYAPDRPGQGRGFPVLASVIARVRDTQTYEDAEIQRKNLETRLSVIASGDPATLAMTDSESISEVRNTGSLGEFASGGITQVPSGLGLTVIEPKAAGGYVEYIKHQLHLIASGMGVTYEMMTGDVSEVNFSSARVAMLEFRRNAEAEQWNTVIPNLCNRIYKAFIDACVLSGELTRPAYEVDWSTPKWDYVNPEQEVSADLKEISGGLASISEKLRRRGYKPDLVFSEIKSDFERLKRDGTLDYLMFLQKGALPQDAQAQGQQAQRSVTEEVIDRMVDLQTRGTQVQVEQHSQSINAIADLAKTLAEKAPAPITINNTQPTIEVRNEIPEQQAPNITVTNEVQTPIVEVRNTIETPEVSVNVAAPEVRVENHVQPAEVALQLPVRKTETQVVRDKSGRIVNTIQTESDA